MEGQPEARSKEKECEGRLQLASEKHQWEKQPAVVMRIRGGEKGQMNGRFGVTREKDESADERRDAITKIS